MAQPVPDKILSWLHNSLKNEYHDVYRTYHDVFQTLAQYPSITPRTEIYTYENGVPALLVNIQGTLPVPFRGTTYRFPITLWIPHAYPQEPPMAYVKAGQAMAIRPGQHVGAEGRVYHPYLAHWANHWDKSTILDFLAILRDVFAKEPPVISKQQAMQRHAGEAQMVAPPPVPPPPAELRGIRQFSQQPVPPPPPPKPSEGSYGGSRSYSETNGAASHTDSTPPPLPPKSNAFSTDKHGYRSPPPLPSQSASPRTLQSFSQIGPPATYLPPGSTPGYPARGDRSAGSIGQEGRRMQPTSNYQQHLRHSPPNAYQAHSPPYLDQTVQTIPQDPRNVHQNMQNYQQPYTQAPAATVPKPSFPIPDLLSAPLDVTLVSRTADESSGPAPPIPPNPEKDALLHAVSLALREQYNQIMSQNVAAIPALESQHAAMQRAFQNMQSEMQQLQQLDAMLSSNEKILHEALRDTDRIIESVSNKEVPAVDDVLVAPTIVGEQLYRLVADERGIADAIFALSRALDKGRVGGEVFIKQTRSLAREQFLKKALIKKIAHGMGLNTESYA